ncbi:MAG: thioredoxin [Candidatus Kerfeldbacteria bacterium]|nr:thioredoxin [Candidatus Kerfeldbacteria bacterium]
MPSVIGTDQNFQQEVLNEKGRPVLIDFWATWCYPCKTQSPIIEQIGEALGAKVKVVKIDVDENPNISQQYNILSIPTLGIYKDGKLVWQGVGLHQKAAIESELSKHL